jgi:hypothetical protein
MSAIESKVNKTGVQKAAKKVEYSPLMDRCPGWLRGRDCLGRLILYIG